MMPLVTVPRTDTTLTIGGVSDTFTSITANKDSIGLDEGSETVANESGNSVGCLTLTDLLLGILGFLASFGKQRKFNAACGVLGT
jgi:hypothetical protein